MIDPGIRGIGALVTGVNNPEGIGAAVARALAAQGARLFPTYRRTGIGGLSRDLPEPGLSRYKGLQTLEPGPLPGRDTRGRWGSWSPVGGSLGPGDDSRTLRRSGDSHRESRYPHPQRGPLGNGFACSRPGVSPNGRFHPRPALRGEQQCLRPPYDRVHGSIPSVRPTVGWAARLDQRPRGNHCEGVLARTRPARLHGSRGKSSTSEGEKVMPL